MKISSSEIEATLEKARLLLKEEKGLSASFKAIFEVLILVVTLLMNRLNLNSSNSSKPPSSDPNRKKKKKSDTTGRKPGGQNGHKGTRLEKVENPDKIKLLKIDPKSIPPGQYEDAGFVSRQVFDLEIKRVVTEYRAQRLKGPDGKIYIAPFPDNITCEVQYGEGIKAHAIYLSMYQMIPYNRIQDYFADQIKVPISPGSIFNFNKEAYDRLAFFDERAKKELIQSSRLNADETGININGKREWLHLASNDFWTYYYPHKKRGSEAMDEIGIIPNFRGVLCHDHWKPYYKYDCLHSLCNGHHLRELERTIEQDKQKWATQMKDFLLMSNEEVSKSSGCLPKDMALEYREKYHQILYEADLECPDPPKIAGKRGRKKKSTARNLLERLRNCEDDVLRFMENVDVPFTNNLAENDLRMTKVQQKISGCFRSMEGAYIFCRIRSYISTCRKQGIKPSVALRGLFEGNLPDFLREF